MKATVLATVAWAAFCAMHVAAAHAQFDDPAGFGREKTLRAPETEKVREQALAWLAEQGADNEVLDRAEKIWNDDAGPYAADVVLRLAATMALVDQRAADLVHLCSQPRQHVIVPAQEWLADENLAPLVRDNLRLLHGRWLAQEKLYDEALAELDALEPDDVVDPASLLFYQGVVHHRMLQRDHGLKAIGKLLNEVADSPRRYTAVASLMESDLRSLEDDSLDHISRRMEDIGRRLEFGRSGQRVVKIENGVIESLDKLIEEMEKQQQQQQSGGGASGNRIQSSNPAPDSAPIGGIGPGDVDSRDIGSGDGWGNLPPKERQQALQQIGKDFPSHYRDAIQQYFRRLAGENRAN